MIQSIKELVIGHQQVIKPIERYRVRGNYWCVGSTHIGWFNEVTIGMWVVEVLEGGLKNGVTTGVWVVHVWGITSGV